jgi:predicted nuclease of predicted toxin-antitoxin system
MARLYANENFPLPVVEALRTAGHDVLTVAETGKAGQVSPDEDVLEFADQDDRILLTLNRKHFIRLHRAGVRHAGIVVCTVDPDFAGQASRIDGTLMSQADCRGQLLRVNRPGRSADE